jgi:adenylyltransferase/sulfurtransferase
MLTDREKARYHRQMMLPDFGEMGQEKLKQAHVLIPGVGGLGSPVALYLAAAGVGRLTIVDKDRLEVSNLNRQILHWEENVGEYKTVSGFKKLSALNSDIEIIPITGDITADNVDELVRGKDVVVDCMDNFPTRFLLNAACVRARVPFIHGSIYGLEGCLTTIVPGQTPCLSCIYPVDPVEVKPFPVLGAAPGVTACLQAMETIKLLVGLGGLLTGRFLFFDGGLMEFNVFNIARDRQCRVCGELN